jgi:DNA-directed RNA polymerase subunit M/transcription elongation factor TFIIS
MHIDPLLASTVVTGLNNTLNILKNAKELAKDSSDTKLKDELSNLYDSFLTLKEKLLELKDANVDLQRQLTVRETIQRDSKTGFFFREGETDPLCPTCYQKDGLVFHLDKGRTWDGGAVTRFCKSCKNSHTEVQGADVPRTHIVRSQWP